MRAHLEIIVFCLLAGVASGQQQADAPNPADALYQAAKADLAAGKYAEAEAAFRKVAEMDPSSVRGMMGVVEVYLGQKKNDEAMALLQEESKKNPNRLDIHLNIGEVALGAGKFDLAVSEFLLVLNRMQKTNQGAGELYFRIGQAYVGQRKPDFAIIFLRQAHELLPGNAKVSILLANTLDSNGQKDAALRVYVAALEADPNNGALLNNLAFLLTERGTNLDAALSYAKRARQLAPDSDAVADTLGWVSLKKNLTDEAIGLFRESVQKDPARSTYRYHLAVALEQKGDHAAAMEELQAALKNNPPKDEEPKIRELMAKIGK